MHQTTRHVIVGLRFSLPGIMKFGMKNIDTSEQTICGFWLVT